MYHGEIICRNKNFNIGGKYMISKGEIDLLINAIVLVVYCSEKKTTQKDLIN